MSMVRPLPADQAEMPRPRNREAFGFSLFHKTHLFVISACFDSCKMNKHMCAIVNKHTPPTYVCLYCGRNVSASFLYLSAQMALFSTIHPSPISCQSSRNFGSSQVGYILGLGDRHPSNITLDKMTNKVIHIDFESGRCSCEFPVNLWRRRGWSAVFEGHTGCIFYLHEIRSDTRGCIRFTQKKHRKATADKLKLEIKKIKIVRGIICCGHFIGGFERPK